MVKLQQQKTDKWLQGTDDGGKSENKEVVLCILSVVVAISVCKKINSYICPTKKVNLLCKFKK